jgi:predicted RNA-binding Zn ribbon-like protein
MPVEPSPDAVLVQQFANTRDLRTFIPRGHAHRDGTADELSSPDLARAWLAVRDLLPEGTVVSESDHARIHELRSTLRAALDRTRNDHSPRASPPPFAASLQVHLDVREGPRLITPGSGVSRAIEQICTAALRTALTGEWWRLRACAADDCQWIFYDTSKPGRGRYCAPDSCGNRVKTRAYRQRKADAGTRSTQG